MWFELALVSMASYGLLDFMFKVAAEKHFDFSVLSVYYYASAGLLSFLVFVASPEPIPDFAALAFVAIVQVSFYLLANVLKLEALRFVGGYVAFPIFYASGIVVALLAVALLGEQLTAFKAAGIALTVFALALLLEKKRAFKPGRGVAYSFGAMLSLAAAAFVVVVASKQFSIPMLMAVSYFFAIVPAFMLETYLHKRHTGSRIGAVRLGVALGIVNVIAFYSFLSALRQGPASVITPIVSLALIVAVLLSMLVFGERLGWRKWLGVLLAAASIAILSAA
jgi:drug/metabolite transporter (DMT)-like permease